MAKSLHDTFTELVDRFKELPAGVSASVQIAGQDATFVISDDSTTISQVFSEEELVFIALGHGLGQFVLHLINDCVNALHNATFQKRLIKLHRG